MRRLKKRYLILLFGIGGWIYYPIPIAFPLQLLLTGMIYGLFVYLDQLLNPGIPKNNDISEYDKIRDGLQTGDVIAFGGQGIFSKLIRKTLGGDYSHVGMIVRFDDLHDGDRIFILEALSQKGVVLMPFSTKLLTYQGTAAVWYALDPKPLPPETPAHYREVIREYLLQQLGKNYDYQDIEYFIKKFLLRLRHLKNIWNDPSRMICSELVAYALQTVHLCSFANCSEVSPMDIISLDCLAKPGHKILF